MERLDTVSGAGERVFHVFGAHFERRLIVERTKNGIAAARARGKQSGQRRRDRPLAGSLHPICHHTRQRNCHANSTPADRNPPRLGDRRRAHARSRRFTRRASAPRLSAGDHGQDEAKCDGEAF